MNVFHNQPMFTLVRKRGQQAAMCMKLLSEVNRIVPLRYYLQVTSTHACTATFGALVRGRFRVGRIRSLQDDTGE